jgi:hypothetical protein
MKVAGASREVLHQPPLLPGRARGSRAAAAGLSRALHGGLYPARCLGFPEERAAARRGWGRFPEGSRRNQSADFRGQSRRNETHVSRTNPEARLTKKARGEGARLAYAGHVPMENRNGLGVELAQAMGRAERRRRCACWTGSTGAVGALPKTFPTGFFNALLDLVPSAPFGSLQELSKGTC